MSYYPIKEKPWYRRQTNQAVYINGKQLGLDESVMYQCIVRYVERVHNMTTNRYYEQGYITIQSNGLIEGTTASVEYKKPVNCKHFKKSPYGN